MADPGRVGEDQTHHVVTWFSKIRPKTVLKKLRPAFSINCCFVCPRAGKVLTALCLGV
jgi:hypothetical protein